MKTSGEVSAEKLRGGFYTPAALVHLCLDRVTSLVGDRESLAVLEPSAGDGAFIRGLDQHALSRRVSRLTAIELIPEEAVKCRAESSNVRFEINVIVGSALEYDNWAKDGYDIAVGNPPFVRFQFIDESDAQAASALAKDLGISFAGVSNLWLPILLVSLSALKDGGAFAFIVPAEFFTGISANVARQWLINHVERLQVDLFPVGSFPGVMQEVVVVSGLARRATRIASPRLLLEEHSSLSAGRRWEHITAREARTWTGYLLKPEHLDALEEARNLEDVHRIGDFAKFEVATVTGANDFFTVDEDTLSTYQLGPWALSLLPRVRYAAGLRFTEDDYASLKASGARSYLLSFSADRPTPTGHLAQIYLRYGENEGLPERYKCRIRSPWYRVPVVAPGRIMLSKRSHRYPRLILNCVGAHTTDTVYRGRILPGSRRDASDLVAAFHNSLTLLTSEVEGRSFGGGVLELVPTEVGSLLVPIPQGFGQEVERLDVLARTASTADGEVLIEETDRLLAKNVDGLTSSLMGRLQDARAHLLARRMDRNAAI